MDEQAEARRPAAPFRELVLSGTPYRRGLIHGRALRREIRQNVSFYLGLLADKGLDQQRALRFAGWFAPAIRRHTPELMREIEGIAKGSGSTVQEILLLNARTELIAVAKRRAAKTSGQPAPRPEPSTRSPGCTSVAVTGGGKLALGQNWDWRAALQQGSVVLRIKRRDGPDVVTFTEAGMVGKIGFNDRRVGVCLNFLSHGDEGRAPFRFGVPVHLLLRSAMHCSSAKEAAALISRLPRSASANFLIGEQPAGGKPAAIDLETTPKRTVQLPLGNRSFLVHANNYQHPSLATGCDRRDDPTTLQRDAAAHRVARATQHRLLDPVKRAARILSDRSAANPISRAPSDRESDKDGLTVASIVMNLGDARTPFLISRGAPSHNLYVERPAKPSVGSRLSAWLTGVSAAVVTSTLGQRAARTLSTARIGRGRSPSTLQAGESSSSSQHQ